MKNFTQIFNAIIKDTNISDSAFRTYVALKTFEYGSSKIFPSINTLKKLRGKSSKTIITHLKELKKKGYISYKRRGFSASNEYKLIGEEKFTNDGVIGDVNDTSMVKKSSSLLLQKFQPNNTKINNKEFKNIVDTDFETMEIGLNKIANDNPWLKSKRSRLIEKKSIR